MNKERLSDVYARSKVEALDRAFNDAGKRWAKPLLWCSALGTDGVTYGLYKHISREDLEGREFEIVFWDYAVGLMFTDVLYDPRTRTHVPKTARD